MRRVSALVAPRASLRRGSRASLAGVRLVDACRPRSRAYASAAAPESQLVVQRQDCGRASVQLHAPPVNALSTPLLRELLGTLRELDEDKSVRGLVLGSAVPGIFSAGIHLPELLVGPDGSVDKIAEFWTLLQETWLELYTSPLATVAAIAGHCEAAHATPTPSAPRCRCGVTSRRPASLSRRARAGVCERVGWDGPWMTLG
jgi:hypothetical protein